MNYEDIGERRIKPPVRAIMVGRSDNVAVLLSSVKAGEIITINLEHTQIAQEDMPAGYKIAAKPLSEGQAVITYGQIIGHAARPICPGERIHFNNLCNA
jgi:SAF domain